MYTLFFAVWLLTSQAAHADADPSGQAQAQKAKRWEEYVEGCSKQIIPPIPPIKQAAIMEMCLSIFRQVTFGKPPG